MRIFLSSFFSFTFEPIFFISSQLTTWCCHYSQKTSMPPIYITHELYMKQVMLICYPLSYIRLLYGPKSLDSLALPLVWQFFRPAEIRIYLYCLISFNWILEYQGSGQHWKQIARHWNPIFLLRDVTSTLTATLSILLIIIFKFMIRHKETACKVIALNSNW